MYVFILISCDCPDFFSFPFQHLAIPTFPQQRAVMVRGYTREEGGAWEDATCLIQMTLIKPSVKEKQAAGAVESNAAMYQLSIQDKREREREL